MARLAYIGDRRTRRVNWGCRATSEAMYQLLSQRFEIIGTCSNRDFTKPTTQDALSGNRFAKTLLRVRKLGRPADRIVSAYLRMEKNLGLNQSAGKL